MSRMFLQGPQWMAHSLSSRPLRVVLAEDEPMMADVLRHLLMRAGHTVQSAMDGAPALDLICAAPERADLLITDYRMPRLSGLGLVSKLRDTAFSGVIVVQSSHLAGAEREAFEALAVDHILTKPVRLPTWESLIRQIAERAALR